MLAICHKKNIISENPLHSSSLLEPVNQEDSIGMDLDDLSVGRCETYKGLMPICKADNIFPEDHIDPSSL